MLSWRSGSPLDDNLDDLERAINELRSQLAARREAAVNEAVAAARSAGPLDDHDMSSLVTKAQLIYDGRRARDKIFAGLSISGEPAWDILLDLFIANYAGRSISVSSACLASAAAPTTALRWIETLTNQGLIERVPDPSDRRRAFVRLTESGHVLVARGVARS